MKKQYENNLDSKLNKSEKMLDLQMLMKPYFCMLYLIMYHEWATTSCTHFFYMKTNLSMTYLPFSEFSYTNKQNTYTKLKYKI